MPKKVSAVEARQGQTLNRMRYVLAASLVLAVAGLAAAAGIALG